MVRMKRLARQIYGWTIVRMLQVNLRPELGRLSPDSPINTKPRGHTTSWAVSPYRIGRLDSSWKGRPAQRHTPRRPFSHGCRSIQRQGVNSSVVSDACSIASPVDLKRSTSPEVGSVTTDITFQSELGNSCRSDRSVDPLDSVIRFFPRGAPRLRRQRSTSAPLRVTKASLLLKETFFAFARPARHVFLYRLKQISKN